jgi:hypothetical protein
MDYLYAAGRVQIEQAARGCLPYAGDIRIIQALLGHDKLDTTARYTRVATGMIAGIESPLDLLSQPRKKPRKNGKDQPPT